MLSLALKNSSNLADLITALVKQRRYIGQGVCTCQHHMLLVAEAHAAKYVAQVLCRPGRAIMPGWTPRCRQGTLNASRTDLWLIKGM